MVLPFKGILYDTISFAHSQGPNMHGRKGTCGDFELNYVECLEAYGLVRGLETCLKYHEDLQECRSNYLKDARAKMMDFERYKKIAKGEIPFKERHGKPVPYDAFITGTFWP